MFDSIVPAEHDSIDKIYISASLMATDEPVQEKRENNNLTLEI